MNETNRPRVIVFHPYGQHSYFLAAAVQRAGMLRHYIARLYYDRSRFPFSLVRLLPAKIKRQVEDLLYRRQWKDIDSRKVLMLDVWSELLFIVLKRLDLMKRWREAWFVRSLPRFSRHVGRIALREADIMIGTDGASLEAFRAVDGSAIVRVLDMAHPHILSEMRVKTEEAAYAPPGEAYDSMITTEEEIQHHVAETRLAHAFIVASAFSKSTLVENGIDPQRIFALPYGVEERFFCQRQTRSSHNKPMTVLFSGIIGQRKGIRYLLSAVHRLRTEGYDIKVHITGNFYDVPKSYGPFQDTYVNLGRVSDSELPGVFAEADVFALPSLFEGFGRVILEAMAAGLPIIATPNTGAPDIITEGREGFIVPIRDVEALEAKLRYFYDHPETREQMGQFAQQTARCYTWERYYDGIGKVLDTIWYQRDHLMSKTSPPLVSIVKE